MSSALQSELSAMVQEMQNLETALSDLGTLVTHAATTLQQVEHRTDALVVTASNAVQHHEEDLHALGNEVHTTAAQFKSEIDHTGQQLHSESGLLASTATKTFAAVDTATQNADHLDEAAVQHSRELAHEMQQFDDLIKHLEESLSSRVQTATQSATQGVQHLGEVAQKWEQKGSDVAHSLSESLRHTTDEVDQKFIAPLTDGVKQFADLAKQIEEGVVSNPIAALSDKLKNAILSEAQHEIDAVAQQLGKVIEDAISAITDAGGGNDAINKEVHALFAELQPLWDALTDALRSVQQIWDTVKNAVGGL